MTILSAVSNREELQKLISFSQGVRKLARCILFPEFFPGILSPQKTRGAQSRRSSMPNFLRTGLGSASPSKVCSDYYARDSCLENGTWLPTLSAQGYAGLDVTKTAGGDLRAAVVPLLPSILFSEVPPGIFSPTKDVEHVKAKDAPLSAKKSPLLTSSFDSKSESLESLRQCEIVEVGRYECTSEGSEISVFVETQHVVTEMSSQTEFRDFALAEDIIAQPVRLTSLSCSTLRNRPQSVRRGQKKLSPTAVEKECQFVKPPLPPYRTKHREGTGDVLKVRKVPANEVSCKVTPASSLKSFLSSCGTKRRQKRTEDHSAERHDLSIAKHIQRIRSARIQNAYESRQNTDPTFTNRATWSGLTSVHHKSSLDETFVFEMTPRRAPSATKKLFFRCRQ